MPAHAQCRPANAPGHTTWNWVAALTSLLALRRARARLKTLEPHLLRDIGLTDEAAAYEANRPVWDAPNHWIRR